MIVLTVCVFMGQILSGAMGVDIDKTTWETPAMRTRVKEIDLHEAHTFKIIMRKNGVRQTLTPALLQAGRNAAAIATEQKRAKALLGLGGRQVKHTYECPFAMVSCNGRAQACARCESLFENGDMPRPAERKTPAREKKRRALIRAADGTAEGAAAREGNT